MKENGNPVTCVRCGQGGGTLYRLRDEHGSKTHPAQYIHHSCPYVPPKPLTLEEVWAERRPVEKADES